MFHVSWWSLIFADGFNAQLSAMYSHTGTLCYGSLHASNKLCFSESLDLSSSNPANESAPIKSHFLLVANVRFRQLENAPISSIYCFNSFAGQNTYKHTSVLQYCTLLSFPTMLRSHLTVLESSAARYPFAPVFKIPQLDSQGRIESWESITYQGFREDVESHARYWTSVFNRDRIPQRSVVGIWYVDTRIAAT